MAAHLFESEGQLIGKRLRPTARVVIAEKVRESEHRIEHERSATRWRPPMPTISGKQEFELPVAEVLVQRVSHSHASVMLEPICLAPAKIRKKPKHVDL